MKAFILDRYGSADGVRMGDLPDPEPREDEVLVQNPCRRYQSARFENQKRRIQAGPAVPPAAYSRP
jgi:hypothetical protein